MSTVNDVDIQNIPEHNVYKSLDDTNTTTSSISIENINNNSNNIVNANTNTASVSDCTIHYINFHDFLLGLSLFNSIGNSDLKIKLAFRLQDFDDDGMYMIK